MVKRMFCIVRFPSLDERIRSIALLESVFSSLSISSVDETSEEEKEEVMFNPSIVRKTDEEEIVRERAVPVEEREMFVIEQFFIIRLPQDEFCCLRFLSMLLFSAMRGCVSVIVEGDVIWTLQSLRTPPWIANNEGAIEF